MISSVIFKINYTLDKIKVNTYLIKPKGGCNILYLQYSAMQDY